MKPKKYKYKGESLTLGEWAKKLGVPYNNLFMRLKQGWTFERAVEEPVRPRGKRGGKKARKRKRTEGDGSEPARKRGGKGRRGRPLKSADTDVPPSSDASQAGIPPDGADADRGGDSGAERKGPAVPNKPRTMTKDFLRGMAEGIWLTISSVAMMMAEGGAEAAGRNLQRVEEMFKGGFAEKFASAVTGKGK